MKHTVDDIRRALSAEVLCLPDGSAVTEGVYVGDLLSWVMSHASKNMLWVTIMSNMNVIAVASLVGIPCVIIADGASVSEDVVSSAKAKGINLLRTADSAYGVCAALAALFG